MAGKKTQAQLTPEEKLQQALVPEAEQPYKIPDNWCWTRLDKIVFITTGKKDANYGHENGKFPFFTCASEPIRCDDYSFDGESLLLPGNGANVGLVIYYNGKFEAYQRTYVLQPISKNFYLKFIYYNILTFWKEYNKDKQYGSATNYIKLGNFKNYFVPLPPLTEQQRIVERIESLFAKLDEAKENLQNVLDGFETRKAAILHKAFSGELTANWRKQHGVSMDSWEEKTLNEQFNIVSGIQKTPIRIPRSNFVPYITVANVYRNKLDLDEVKNFEIFEGELERYRLLKEDILIVEGNGSGNEIGRCAVWNDELPICVHQNHIIRLRKRTNNILPNYVLYYLNSDDGKQVIKLRAKTTAGLFNLSTGKIKTIIIPVPNLPEQTEIVRIIDDLLAKEQQVKEIAEDALAKIDLIKKSILARAFRGELGTNNPADEPAVELLKQVL